MGDQPGNHTDQRHVRPLRQIQPLLEGPLVFRLAGGILRRIVGINIRIGFRIIAVGINTVEMCIRDRLKPSAGRRKSFSPSSSWLPPHIARRRTVRCGKGSHKEAAR